MSAPLSFTRRALPRVLFGVLPCVLLCSCLEESVTRYSVDFSSCLQVNTTQLSNLDPSCGGELRDFLGLPAVEPLGCWRFSAADGSGEERVVSMRWEGNQFTLNEPLTEPLPSALNMEMWAYEHSYESCDAAVSFDPRCELASCFMHVSRQGATLSEERALSFRDQAGRCDVSTGLAHLRGVCELPGQTPDATPPADEGAPDAGAPEWGAPDAGAPDALPPPLDATPLSECEERRAEVGQECTVPDQRRECARGVYVCDPDRQALVCRPVDMSTEQELCDGLDNNCDGVIDSPETCAELISDHCELWLAWTSNESALSQNEDNAPLTSWGSCPGQELPYTYGDYNNRYIACVSSGRDTLFHPLSINSYFEHNSRLGLMWRCAETFVGVAPREPLSDGERATIEWADERCAAALYINPNGRLTDPPLLCGDNGSTSSNREACVRSPSRRFSKIGGQTLLPNAYLGLSFSCDAGQGGAPGSLEARGALIQQGVKVELGIVTSQGLTPASPVNQGIWTQCNNPETPVLDTSGSLFCVESGPAGQRLSGNLRPAAFSSGTWFSVALRPR